MPVASCRGESNFEVCQAAGTLVSGVTQGNTTQGTNLVVGSCGGDNGLERLHVFTPDQDGVLQVGLTSEAPLALYLWNIVVVDGLEPLVGAAYTLTTLLTAP